MGMIVGVFMHRKLTGDVASIPKSPDNWTGVCSALKQNGFLILLNVYALELRHANLQAVESIQGPGYSMPTIPREELDAVLVAILDLRPCLANLWFLGHRDVTHDFRNVRFRCWFYYHLDHRLYEGDPS